MSCVAKTLGMLLHHVIFITACWMSSMCCVHRHADRLVKHSTTLCLWPGGLFLLQPSSCFIMNFFLRKTNIVISIVYVYGYGSPYGS